MKNISFHDEAISWQMYDFLISSDDLSERNDILTTNADAHILYLIDQKPVPFCRLLAQWQFIALVFLCLFSFTFSTIDGLEKNAF